MSFDAPFALFITWTCYGTWLPGDARGYVSNTQLPKRGFKLKENTPGTPYRKDDPLTRRFARAQQRGNTAYLTVHQAFAVAESLVDVAQRHAWRVLRAAVMANHVHVVVSDCPDDGEAVRRVFKGNAQARLSEMFGRSRRWWTAGGSDRYLHTFDSIEAAIRYVAAQRGKLAEVVNMQTAVVEHRAS